MPYKQLAHYLHYFQLFALFSTIHNYSSQLFPTICTIPNYSQVFPTWQSLVGLLLTGRAWLLCHILLNYALQAACPLFALFPTICTIIQLFTTTTLPNYLHYFPLFSTIHNYSSQLFPTICTIPNYSQVFPTGKP